MTLQEIYDTVKSHLLKQGERAGSGVGGVCYYRARRLGRDPLKCAVGCLIPDDVYSPSIEGSSVSELYNRTPEVLATGARLLYDILDAELEGLDDEKISLLMSLQTTHDGVKVERWESQLEEVAKNKGLVP